MEPKPNEVGQRIKRIRIQLGLSQKDFAERIDSTIPAVSNWENGRNLPNKERLKTIAQVGKVTVNDLLYGTNEVDLSKRDINANLAEILKVVNNHEELIDMIKDISEFEAKHNDNKVSKEVIDNFILVSSGYLEIIENITLTTKLLVHQKNTTDVFDEAYKKIDPVINKLEALMENAKSKD